MSKTLKIIISAGFYLAALTGFCHAQTAETIRSIAFVNTDANAESLFKVSLRAEAKEDWPATVKCLQELLEKYPDKVVTLENNLYTGVSFYCRNRLMGLPPEGITAYKNAFDARAGKLYDDAAFRKDTAGLRNVIESYPASTYAIKSAMTSANILMSTGNLAEAREILEELQNFNEAERKDVEGVRILRLGMIYFKMKDKPALKSLYDYALLHYSGPAVTIADNSQEMPAYLETLLNRTPEPAPRVKKELDKISWPAFGGNSRHDELMDDFSSLPKKKWTFYIPVSTYSPISFKPSPAGGFFSQGTPMYTPFYPLIADGKLFMHNGATLYAYDLFSSRDNPLLWQHTENNPNQILYDEKAFYSGAIYDNKLLFVNLVGSIWPEDKQLGWLHVKMPFPCRTLTAFDINTGKISWRRGGDVSKTDFLSHASFPAPPSLEDGNLYAPVVYSALATDPPEQYIVCLDAETGNLKWKTFIASGFLEINLFNSPAREQFGSAITIWNGLLLYCTNNGAIAGIDKYTGEVIWKRTYNQYKITPTRDNYIERTPTGWLNNPILVDNVNAYVAPMDSPALIILEAQTGKSAWQWENIGNYNPPRYILGIRNNKIFITNDVELLALSTLPQDKGRIKSRTQFNAGERITGRGALTEKNICLPTSGGIYQLDLASDKQQQSISWEQNASAECGNILAFGDLIVTTSLNYLNIYMSGQVLEEYLKRVADREPSNPVALYNYAQSLVAAEKFDLAEDYLKKIIQLTRNDAGNEMQSIRQKSVLQLGETAVKKAGKAWDEDRKNEAFDIITTARALSGESYFYTKLTLELCYFHELAGNAETVVDEMQKLLARYPDGVYDAESIRLIVREKISKMIVISSGKAYEKYENQAGMLLGEGTRKKNTDMLKKIVQLYPNSRSAEEAALALAEEFSAQGKLEEAAETLQYFRRDFPDSKYLPEAMLKLAELSDKNRLYTSAKMVYASLLRDFPDAVIKQDSIDTTIGAIVRKKLSEKPYSEMPTPDFKVKNLNSRPSPSWSVAVPNTDSLNLLVNDTKYASGKWADRVILANDRMIFCVSAVNGNVLWKANMPAPPLGAYYANDRLILAYSDKLTAFDTGGNQLWLFPANNVTKQAIITDTASYTAVIDGANQNNMFLTAIDNLTGRELWKTSLLCRTLAEIQYYEGLLFIPLTPLNKLAVYDAAFGTEMATVTLPSEIRKVFAVNRNRFCVLLRTEEIYCFETGSGKLLWKIKAEGINENVAACDNGILACCIVSKADSNFNSILAVNTADGSIKQADLPRGSRIKQLMLENDTLFAVISAASSNNFAPNNLQVNAYNITDLKQKWSYTQQIATTTAGYFAKSAGRYMLLSNAILSQRNVPMSLFLEVLDTEKGGTTHTMILPFQTRNVKVDLFNGTVYIIADGTVLKYE